MKKTMIAVVLATVAAAAPAHAISAKYRAQLERSGCTQVSEAQGCNINHTKAQNRAAGFGETPKQSAPDYGISAYVGSYGVFAPNGQRLEQLVISKNGSVKLNGKEITVTTEPNWLTFEDGANVYTLYRNHHGEWRNTNSGNGGTIGR